MSKNEASAKAFPYDDLRSAVAGSMARDQHRLTKQLERLHREHKQGKDVQQALVDLIEKLETSVGLVQKRADSRPAIHFDDSLPVSQRVADVEAALATHQVVIVAGETGSGKTTQLPKLCLQQGRGLRGWIGHTQPRRIAASTVAARIAEELNSPLGQYVGYQVRFQDSCPPEAYIKLMTDGILLADIQSDPFLTRYDTLIIDEAHERSLNIDFLLGYLKRILPQRPDLKVLITSATIDLQRFSKHFDDAPIIEVSGRTYPVDMKYRPWQERFDDQSEAIIDALHEITREHKGRNGDVLVFLSGEREIRETAKAIKNADFKHFSILPLYARLSLAEQAKIFQKQKGRRIVLATNVAETSLTVPGIEFVIDPGLARISRYSIRTKVQRLPIEAISQASARQRAGRCGRVSSGVCFRLYSEDDFEARPAFTDPEIQRTNLAAVILQMLQMNIGDVRRFPFIEPPDNKNINDGFALLEDLQAIDNHGKLTPLGKKMAQLPIDPQLGRMVIEAEKRHCLAEILVIVSALAMQDPRERPADKQQAADEKHRRFADKKSDFIGYLNLWHYVETQRQNYSQNQWRKQSAREFLSFLRLREWRDLHHQLSIAVKKHVTQQKFSLELKESSEGPETDYEALHRSILPGLLANIGLRDDEATDRSYRGTRNRQFTIFPGSALFKARPKWVLAAEMIETAKLYAHCVAHIESQWVVDAAQHRIKHHYYEPHYSTKTGHIMAYDRMTLFGLVLEEKRRTKITEHDAKVSRDIFIRAALVEGRYQKSLEKSRHQNKAVFYQKNQATIAEIADLEDKSRRKDILVDDEVVYRFYDERLPEDITHLAAFEKWRKVAEREAPELLIMPKSLLMQHGADSVTEAQFPDTLDIDGMSLPLTYHFEPGHPKDGVTIHIPVALLHQLSEARLTWLVPGMLRDLCITLVKALPKQWRKRVVPVPHHVDQILARVKPDGRTVTTMLTEEIGRLLGEPLPSDLWEDVLVDDFYRMNICVTDEQGKSITSSRDLDALKQSYKNTVKTSLAKAGSDLERDTVTDWDFGKLNESVNLKKGKGVQVKAYPALVVEKKDIALRLLDNPQDAQLATEKGMACWMAQKLQPSVKYLKKTFLKNKDMVLSVLPLGSREELLDDMVEAIIREVCQLEHALPRDKAAFEKQLAAANSALIPKATEYERQLLLVLNRMVSINKSIKNHKQALAMFTTFSDIRQQLESLVYPGFLSATPLDWFAEFPRYFEAIEKRLEKAPMSPQKDKLATQTVQKHWKNHIDRMEKEGAAAYRANAAWRQYRWLVEELRVSLFAQTLRTKVPVSDKRLSKIWMESF